MSEVKLLKLVTGEEVIAKITENRENNSYKLENPIKIGIVPNGNNVGIAMVELTPFSKDKEFYINFDKVIFVCNPIDEIKNKYLAPSLATGPGNGLILPN